MSIAHVIVDERLTGSGEISRFFNQIPTASMVGFRPEDIERATWRICRPDSQGCTLFRGTPTKFGVCRRKRRRSH